MPFHFELPEYHSSDDAELWLYRYQKAAKMNKWDHQTMLQYVDNCFNYNMQLWVMENEFASWDKFTAAFLLKYSKKVDIDKIVVDLLNIKMRPHEKVNAYIERFESLRNQYSRELIKRKTSATIHKPESDKKSTEKSPATAKSSAADDTEDEEDDKEFFITEKGFVKHFINGLSSISLRRLLRTRRPTSIDEARKLIAEIEDGEDELDEEIELDIVDRNKQVTTVKVNSEVPIKANPSQSAVKNNDEVAEMIANFKNMTLMFGEVVSSLKVPPNQFTNKDKKKRITCWNCLQDDHKTPDCTKACKLCGENGHVHFQCSKYVKKSYNNSYQNQPNETMLIEEVLMSEKRNADSQEEIKTLNKRAKNTIVTRSGNVYKHKPITPLRQNKGKSKLVSIQEPAHPLLPLNDTRKEVVRVPKAKNEEAEKVIDKVFNANVHPLSIKEIGIISPMFRSKFKSKLTKSHAKVPISAKTKTNLIVELGDPVPDASTTSYPKGRGAPRTSGMINGHACETILDGGCTTYVISLDFALRIGITEVLETDTTMMFGNGTVYEPVGLVPDLKVSVGDSDTIIVDAICFDVGDKYDFIIGRKGLHELKITTDWERHHWYLKKPTGNVPLEVYYHVPLRKNNVKKIQEYADTNSEDEYSEDEYPEDDSDYSDEVFLIMEDDELDEELSQLEDNPEKRFGNLIESIKKQTNIEDEVKIKLIKLLHKNKECFGVGYEHLKRTNLVKFHVDTGESRPIYKKPYSFLSFSEKEELKKDLEKMVENGIVVPSTHVPSNSNNGGWSFPVRYVAKKTGDRRLVTNFRDLNAVTVRDPWPLSNLVDVLEALAGSKWFGAVDLLKAFQQIEVEPESVSKLTITTPWGNYSYKVLPFGVLNGPACFNRCIYLAIQPFLNKFATSYLDDVTLYAKTQDEHLKHIELFLERMKETKLTLNANKSSFFQESIILLGFEVSQKGITPLGSKLNKIAEFPRPYNQTGIRAFVNLCGFYRRHVPNFSEKSAPLNDLLKKRVPFIWGDEQEHAFVEMKTALQNASTLFIPSSDTTYNLYTDASDIAIGACLSAVMENGEQHPVCFLSRKLQPAEVRYPIVEKEILSFIYCLDKLRKYLLDKSFNLYCDNTAMCYLFRKAEPSQRLQRWILATQEYTFKTFHIPTTKNCVADALSRFPPKINDDVEENGDDCLENLYEHMLSIEIAGTYEPWIQDVKNYYQAPGDSIHSSQIKKIAVKYRIENDNVYRKVGARFVKVPPIEDRKSILNEVHDGHGHFGIHATWARLYNEFWWPNCYNELKNHVMTCVACQLYSSRTSNPASARVPIHFLFEQFALDFVGPITRSANGNTYVLVAVEAFTRWPIAIATKDTSAQTVANFLYESIFCSFGLPTCILTDNGSSFDNEIIDRFLHLLSVNHKFTSPYRPSTNGRNEQMNGNLMQAIKKLSVDNPEKWDEFLPSVLYSYRTKAHSAVKLSPYEFMFGLPPPSVRQDPLQMLGRSLGFERLVKQVDRNLQIDDYNDLHEYDDKILIKRKTFNPGDKVLRVRHNKHAKLDSNYKPEVLTVVSYFNDGTCQLADAHGRLLKRRLNVASLRQFYQRE